MAQGGLIEQDAFERIARATRKVESWTFDNPSHRAGGGAGTAVQPVFARTTSGTPSGGLYPAVLTRYDAPTTTWVDFAAVELLPLNGETLTNATRYACRPVGFTTAGVLLLAVLQGVATAGSSGTITVEEADGTPQYTGTDTLRVDQADGFVLTQPSAGVARLDQTAASATTVGYVNTTTQTMAGQKTFNAPIRTVKALTGTVGPSFYSNVELHGTGGVSSTNFVSMDIALNATTDFNVTHVQSGSTVGWLRSYYNAGDTSFRVETVSPASTTSKFSVNRNGTVTPGIDGTTGGGDTVVGGIITAVGSSLTGFTNELAQDAVGGILTDTATIDFTYNDGAPSITADVIDNAVTDAKLRQSAGYSVIGRSASSTGNVADITASADRQTLMRLSGSLQWLAGFRLTSVPGSSGATGEPGDVSGDASYLYFCYASNAWGRIAWTSTSF